jgi:stearoyl-CoA desaturase (delta-9 desaturase)
MAAAHERAGDRLRRRSVYARVGPEALLSRRAGNYVAASWSNRAIINSLHIVLIVLVAVALTEMAVLITSIYLHRGLAHRSLVLHPAAELLCRVLLWLTTGQRRQEWVAVHRKHHTFTDREGDPHSPQLLGFWRIQLFNVYYYAREARKADTLRRFAPDLAEDRLDRLVFSHGWTGLAAGTGALCLALGLWAGAAAMVLHAVLYVFVLAPLINGLGHWHGRQTFRNSAYNIRLLSYVTGGESLHNNHHAHPRAPKFSMSRREYDPSWTVIRVLAALRVVTVHEVAAEAS